MARIMVGAGAIFVCILIVIMDVIAGILGIQAEVAQNKVITTFSKLYLFKISLQKIMIMFMFLVGHSC